MKYWILVCVCAALAACGGGGGGGVGGAAPTTTTVGVKVIDGAIQGAKVCLDKNLDGVCNSDEPFAITAASGLANLQVSDADRGKYPIVAEIGTDAVDADTGPVTIPYTLKAPKDQTAIVSPHSNLVQATVESTGVSTAVAAAAVQEQTGLAVSPFTDFTVEPNKPEHKAAQVLANALVVTTQQQRELVKAAVGSTTSEGATITKADIDKLVAQRVAELLPQLLEAATDDAVKNAATAAQRVAALKIKADAILAENGVTSAADAKLAVEVNKAVSSTEAASAAVAGGHVSNFIFTGVNDWYLRLSTFSQAQATPSTDGSTKYVHRRYKKTTQGVAVWAVGSEPLRGSDLSWTGNQWQTCPLNFANTNSARDANGNSTYNYCNGREKGSTQRSASIDLTGKKMIDVYRQIRAAGYSNVSVGAGSTAVARDANATTLLGEATFTVSSAGTPKLFYQTSVNTDNAPSYYPGTGNYVLEPNASLASGNATTCALSPLPSGTAETTLEKLIAASRGTPCRYTNASTPTGKNGVTLNSGAPRSNWTFTSLLLGTIGSAPTYSAVSEASSYYTGNTRLRVSFGENNATTYYQCQQRWDSNSFNCTAIGTGTYVIETLGDARIMRFLNLPSQTKALDYNRVFVERGGKVYFGYQNSVVANKTVRLNLAAMGNVASQLGLDTTPYNPELSDALTGMSYAGVYSGTIAGDDTGTFRAVIDLYGSPTCSLTTGSTGTVSCSVVLVPPSDPASGVATITLGGVSSGASFTGTVNYYTGAVTGTWSNQGFSGTFAGARN